MTVTLMLKPKLVRMVLGSRGLSLHLGQIKQHETSNKIEHRIWKRSARNKARGSDSRGGAKGNLGTFHKKRCLASDRNEEVRKKVKDSNLVISFRD